MSGIEELLKNAKGLVSFDIFSGTIVTDTDDGEKSERIESLEDWRKLLEYLLENDGKKYIDNVKKTLEEEVRKNTGGKIIYRHYLAGRRLEDALYAKNRSQIIPKGKSIKTIAMEVLLGKILANELGLKYNAVERIFFYEKRGEDIQLELPGEPQKVEYDIKSAKILSTKEVKDDDLKKELRDFRNNLINAIYSKIIDIINKARSFSLSDENEREFLFYFVDTVYNGKYYKLVFEESEDNIKKLVRTFITRPLNLEILEKVGITIDEKYISKKDAYIYKMGPITIYMENVRVKEEGGKWKVKGEEGSYIKAYVPVPEKIIEKIEEMVKDLPENIFI